VSREAKNQPGPKTAGRDSMDDVIAVYKRGIDRTLLRENLKLSVEERFEALGELQEFAEELRRAPRTKSP
jgi:hypothetical protein